jgi:hypothetical protein
MVIGTGGVPQGRRVGPFIVAPSNRWSASVPRGSSAEVAITIYNDSPQPVRITKITSPGEKFAVYLERLEEGKKYVVRAKSAPTLPLGRHVEVVKLATDNKEFPELELQLEAGVTSPVVVNPQAISFGTLPISMEGYEIGNLGKFFWVRQSRGAGLEIKNVSSDLPFIKIEVTPEAPGQSYMLKVGFHKEKLKPGDYKGTVKVETNNPDAPVLEVAVTVTAK